MSNLPARRNKSPQTAMLTFAVFLGMGTFPCFAGQTNNGFLVSVQLIPAPQNPPSVPPNAPPIVPPGLPISAFCKKNNIPSAHGAVVTVVCTTGAVVAIEPSTTLGQALTPMHGGAYRYVTQVTPNGDLSDTVDAFGGAGTTTAWRVVKSTDRDYLEMTLGW